MRATIEFNDDLLGEAKAMAARTGRTLDEVVEDALRDALARRRRVAERSTPLAVPSFGEGGFRPGIDLDHIAASLDMMEGIER